MNILYENYKRRKRAYLIYSILENLHLKMFPLFNIRDIQVQLLGTLPTNCKTATIPHKKIEFES